MKPQYNPKLNNLHSKEYEDPRDTKALNALKLNETFDKACKWAFDYGLDRIETIPIEGSCLRVNEKNYPDLYNLFLQACAVLEINPVPKLFIENNPCFNACTTGVKNPIVVITDGLLKHFTDNEILFVIGHELGHVKSEHIQYQIIGNLLIKSIEKGTSFIPFFGNLISAITSTGLNISYYGWSRKSEFTADHAGLLVCQDLKAAISAFIKIAGFPDVEVPIDVVNGFLAQANEFEEYDEETYNKIIRVLSTLEKSHPWTVQRAKELLLWIKNEEFARIILRSSTWMKNEIATTKETIDNNDKEIERLQNLKETDTKFKNIFVNRDNSIKHLQEENNKLEIYLKELNETYIEESPEKIEKLTKQLLKEIDFE